MRQVKRWQNKSIVECFLLCHTSLNKTKLKFFEEFGNAPSTKIDEFFYCIPFLEKVEQPQ